MATKKRVTGSTRPTTSTGAAFHKDVQQPTPDVNFQPGTEPEFDPGRPGAFDLPGFISGAKKHTNTRVIPVTTRPNEASELERLIADRDKLQTIAAEDEQTGEGGTRRRVSAVSARRQQLRDTEARITELEDALEGTWALVKVRALKPSEQDDVRKRKLPVGVPLFCAMFEHVGAVAHPDTPEDWTRLTAAQWQDFVEAIGAAQYLTLDQAVDALSYQAVTPDFFERYSASRATRTTSSS